MRELLAKPAPYASIMQDIAVKVKSKMLHMQQFIILRMFYSILIDIMRLNYRRFMRYCELNIALASISAIILLVSEDI
jgi:hypothetical protein